MEITFSLARVDPKTFVGTAYTGLIGSAEQELALKAYYVHFERTARTNWHTHAGQQTLVVVKGRCRYQIAGEPIQELTAGNSVRFPAGVRHWHGAAVNDEADHLAINEDSRETVWLYPVTDEEYFAG